MSSTQTTASPLAMAGTILLHPRPAKRNSGVLVLVPLLAELPSESRSSMLRVIADTESPQKPQTLSVPPCTDSEKPSLIVGLPYKRHPCARVTGEPPCVSLANSRSPQHRVTAESRPSSPTLPDTSCKPMKDSSCQPESFYLHSAAASAPHRPPTGRACKPSSRSPKITLPAETWFRVLTFVFAVPPGSVGIAERRARAGLMSVSKTFKNLVSPLFYAYPHLSTPLTLTQFADVLQASDRAWDSLRRIPYSTPGRWVQALDLSHVSCTTPAERLAVDTMLTHLFPLTPFLVRLVLNSTVRMSRRAMTALATREGAGLLRVLKGIKWEGVAMTVWSASKEDPLVALVRASVGLEELEVFGPGLQDDEVEDEVATSQLNTPPPTPLPPLCLPRLHTLMILSLPRSPLLSYLVRSPLPSLRHLMVTPYDGVPSAFTSALVETHGGRLHTLAFHTPKMWPPVHASTPPTLLHTSPNLRALSLTFPLPALTAPPPTPATGHPLRVLSLPRPDPAYLYKLEAWLYLGLLQCLEEVHMREVRWLRAGLSSQAAEAGVQGDMREWKRRLGRWRVRVMDLTGRELLF